MREFLKTLLWVQAGGILLQRLFGVPNWETTTIVLTLVVMLTYAIPTIKKHTGPIQIATTAVRRWTVCIGIFALLRILAWSTFGVSMLQSFSIGQGVGPRGAFRLATPAPTRETIIWELLIDGIFLTLSYVTAKAIVPPAATTNLGENSHV